MTKFFLGSTILSLLILPVLISSTPALMVKVSDEELVTTSTCVVIGTVVEQHCRWNRGVEPIVTLHTIAVEGFVGLTSDQETVIVKTLGGVIPEENVRLSMSDQAELKLGSKVMLFLTPDSKEDGIFEVNNYFQGKFTIVNDKVLEKDLPLQIFIQQIEQIQRGGK